MFKKSLILFSVITFGVLAFAPVVNAATKKTPTSYSVDANAKNRQEKIKELREATTAKRCSIITQNINRIVTKYNSRHEAIVQKYKDGALKIKTLLNRLDEKGYDTEVARQKLAEMNNMIVDLSNLNTKFEATLSDSQSIVCGQSNGQFVSKVKEAQGYLKEMRDEAKKIREFFRSDVKPAIQALKNQTPAVGGGTSVQ